MPHEHHHHDHHHHHAHTPASFNLAFGIAVVCNFIFTLIEAVYAIMAHSMSLLADAGHNFGDVLGLAFAWLASWLVTRVATERFSYGYKRTTILAAIINALILVASSVLIAYGSILKLITPTHVNEMIVIIIAFIGIFINGGTALLFMRGRKEDLNIEGAFLHLAFDALLSLCVVLTGFAILYTKWLWLDPIVGLAIVITILVSTWELLRNSVNLILDAVPHHINQAEVKRYLKNISGVKAVHDLHIWGLSTNESALTCHLVMPNRELSYDEYETISHDLKHDHHISHTTIQIEKAEHAGACKQLC